MNYSKIKLELERRGITIKEFCREVDITEQGLHQMIRKGSMKVDILERISEVLDVPISYWFDEQPPNIKNDAPILKDRTETKKTDIKRIDNITTELNVFLKSLIDK